MLEINPKVLQKCFEYFIQQVENRPTYSFTLTDRWKKTSQTFLKELDKRYPIQSLGPVFLSNYLCFQYNYCRGQEGKVFSQSILFNQIFGKAPLLRYLNRDIEFDFVFQDFHDILSEVKIARVLRIKVEFQKSTSDPIRALFLNEEKGFTTCIEQTTLYDHRDKSCVFCNNATDCKKLLVKNYPRIARERGYVK